MYPNPFRIGWLLAGSTCLLLLMANSIGAQEKWVWKKGGGNGRRTGKGDSADSRYEVFEADDIYDNVDEFDYLRPQRPPGGPLLGGIRPGVPGGGNYYPGGGGGGQGVLTGPIPSWEREPPFKNYDSCKCAERFNCNSPGISYGQCDVGKQYCCYNRRGHSYGGPPPSRPINSPENGILVGPGGPVNGGAPFRPPQNDFYGGPRPPPFGSGVLVGPGYRPGGYGSPYDRSAAADPKDVEK